MIGSDKEVAENSLYRRQGDVWRSKLFMVFFFFFFGCTSTKFTLYCHEISLLFFCEFLVSYLGGGVIVLHAFIFCVKVPFVLYFLLRHDFSLFCPPFHKTFQEGSVTSISTSCARLLFSSFCLFLFCFVLPPFLTFLIKIFYLYITRPFTCCESKSVSLEN